MALLALPSAGLLGGCRKMPVPAAAAMDRRWRDMAPLLRSRMVQRTTSPASSVGGSPLTLTSRRGMGGSTRKETPVGAGRSASISTLRTQAADAGAHRSGRR